jgi:hypothetical protein
MKTTKLQCNKCGNHFQIQNGEYNRQIRKGRQHFFCSLSCSQSYNKKTTTDVIGNCLWCEKTFQTTTHKRARKCCSGDCAHKYAQSKVNKNVHKQSVQRPSFFPKEKEFRCVMCDKTFIRMVNNDVEIRKTCSDKCYKSYLSQLSRNNPNCGGGTNYRKYKYSGVWMDSRWEVELAKWLDENKIEWIRDRKQCQFLWTDKVGNKRRYYPDFYLPRLDVYLDPKNKYLIGEDRYKIEKVIEENKITLFWGLFENVKKEIDILRKV